MNSSNTNKAKGKVDQTASSQRPKLKIDLLRWAISLEYLEKGARYLFLALAGLSLIAYSYMVYTQDQWRLNHRQLQKLKNQESQQAIVNARLRNQAAEKAEQSQSGMVNPAPNQAVFIPANDQAQPVRTAKSAEDTSSSENLSKPVGY
jgi:hypothetical protein